LLELPESLEPLESPELLELPALSEEGVAAEAFSDLFELSSLFSFFNGRGAPEADL